MKNSRIIILAALVFFFSVEIVAQENEALRKRANLVFGQLPRTMPGAENDTLDQVRLGERLYFETTLSANRTQSCNSCHNILDAGAGVDSLKTSVGALGKVGTRNAPSTWNAGFQIKQNWDGSVDTLEEQAKSPILNPIEMALDSEKVAIKRLAREGYKKAFKQAFPNSKRPLSFDNIAQALAAFQRTLVTDDRFNHFLAGDDRALNEQEKRGLNRILNNGCSTCHTSPLMGGHFMMKMGLVNPYPNTKDKGMGAITGRPAHDFLFKVPSLRNTAMTAPFFHDGAGEDLEQAVFKTGWHQLGVKLNDEDVADISAFLRALNNVTPYQASSDKLEK